MREEVEDLMYQLVMLMDQLPDGGAMCFQANDELVALALACNRTCNDMFHEILRLEGIE